MTKKEMSDRVRSLEQLGFIVLTFQTNKQLRSGMKGMPDYLICGYGKVIFAEAKLESTGDKLSERQIKVKHAIEMAVMEVAGWLNLEYVILTEDSLEPLMRRLTRIVETIKHEYEKNAQIQVAGNKIIKV